MKNVNGLIMTLETIDALKADLKKAHAVNDQVKVMECMESLVVLYSTLNTNDLVEALAELAKIKALKNAA
jgi:hypothetical protein